MISLGLITSSGPPSCPFILTRMILPNYVSSLLMYTFFYSEMEKPYDQVTYCGFWPELCWQRLGSWLDVYHQEHCLRQICPSHSFFPTIQTQIPPNEVPWLGIKKKLHGVDRHKWRKLFFNPENQVKKGWLDTGKRVNYYKAEKLS
jgi:hypothetical protein